MMVAELVGQLERSIYPMVSKMSRAVAKSAVLMGGSNELVECFCGGAVAEGCSGAVARLVGDGVIAVPGRGSSVAIRTPAQKSFPRSASQFLYTVPDLPGARTPSRCAPGMSPSGRWFRGISSAVLCHRILVRTPAQGASMTSTTTCP